MRGGPISPAAAAMIAGRHCGWFLLLAFVLCSPVARAQTDRQPADTIEARVLACVACHGPAGRGIDNDYFPRLAGKPAGYLTNQLIAFRDGRRRYTPMNYLLEFQQDSYLRQMAEYFAAQRPPPPPEIVPVVSQEILDRGRSLAMTGDAEHGVPACAACHGPAFTGMEPAIPGLLGLRASYLSAQLGAWRYGTRTAIAPDCMQNVAGHLTELDVTAVTAWLAALPIPPDSSPTARGAWSLPFACGSQPK